MDLRKIVVAIDSFKGSVTSGEAAEAVRRGILEADCDCEVIYVPVGDGGEGTAEALTLAMNGHKQTCRVQNPLGEPVDASYSIVEDVNSLDRIASVEDNITIECTAVSSATIEGNTAIMEIAAAAGLTLVPENRRNPLKADTYGVGQMIRHALEHNCRRFMICLGGSATTDAGMGMLQALGYRFYDCENRLLGRGADGLQRVARIDASNRLAQLDKASFAVACDVQNPFYGPDGAACVYARQKGADDAMVKILDKGLHNFAHILHCTTGIDLQKMPGSGAAGGLGGCFASFLDAKLLPGIDMVLDSIGFDPILEGASLVITGEGSLDSQTLMGKTPYGVMRRAKRKGIPVVAIGGSVEATSLLNSAGFDCVLPMLPHPVSLAEAMHKPFTEANLSRTASQLTRLLLAFP